jgi:hypothetical protein
MLRSCLEDCPMPDNHDCTWLQIVAERPSTSALSLHYPLLLRSLAVLVTISVTLTK